MKDPMLLLKTYLEERITIKLRDSQIIRGTLHGFDEHMNVILSNVENNKFLFVRGEIIVAIGQE
jgi:U6 snRNA-associated Sm-like protein LSm3